MEREPTYTVADLTAAIGGVIERGFPDEIWVQGEIRDLSRAPSGHVYFSLVDPGDDPTAVAPATLPVTLFASDKVAINRVLQRSGAGRFEDGVAVRIRGRLSHYGPRGTIQLRMLWIDTDYTLGKFAAERARVVQALADDGLLDRNGLIPFPAVPLRIGLVTSAGSAAHADFLEELAGSGIGFDVTVFDTRVQGLEAEPSLVASIEAAASFEVVAIVRGGGSRTDLAAFDRETVARAVANSPVPVVVGIGHEIDETVIDRVAARSYRTPTACAAGIVADVVAFLRRLDKAASGISSSVRRRLGRADRDLEAAAARMKRSALQRLRRAGGAVEHGTGRLPEASRRRLARANTSASHVAAGVVANARRRVDGAAAALEMARSRMGGANRVLERADGRMRTVAATVEGRDPVRVLARGWTLTTDRSGRIVHDPGVLAPGDPLTTVYATGRVASTVDSVVLDADLGAAIEPATPTTDEEPT